MIELQEQRQGWFLAGLPSEVVAIRLQWQVEFQFGDVDRYCFLQLEGPFTLVAPDGSSVVVDPSGDPADFVGVLPLLRRTVVALSVDSDETLTIAFDDGRVITCPVQANIEAWVLSAGERGFLLTATPRGAWTD